MADGSETELGHAQTDDAAFTAIATRTNALTADIALDALKDAGLAVVSAWEVEKTAIMIAGYEAQVFMLEKKCSELIQRPSK